MAPDHRPVVLITGAGGEVGRALTPFLAQHYRLKLFVWPCSEADRRHFEGLGAEVDEVDITDFSAVAAHTDGVFAVIHLAGQRAPTATWEAVVRPNIDGTYNVFEAARASGVQKILFASTNHVTGGYDRDQEWPHGPEMPVRPDSLYGVTKAFGEALGRYYADFHGVDVICIRIGWFLERPHNEKALRMWLSPRDLRQLFLCGLRSSVHFGIYYGASANTRLKWDMAAVFRDLGYRPVDDSEVFAESVLGA